MLDPLSFLATVGKVMSAGKAVRGVSHAISENSEAKRKQRELNKQIETIENRSIFQALAMYVIAAVAGFFACGLGIIGVVVVILTFLGHCNNLKELSEYTDVKREWGLTALTAIAIGLLFFIL